MRLLWIGVLSLFSVCAEAGVMGDPCSVLIQLEQQQCNQECTEQEKEITHYTQSKCSLTQTDMWAYNLKQDNWMPKSFFGFKLKLASTPRNTKEWDRLVESYTVFQKEDVQKIASLKALESRDIFKKSLSSIELVHQQYSREIQKDLPVSVLKEVVPPPQESTVSKIKTKTDIQKNKELK